MIIHTRTRGPRVERKKVRDIPVVLDKDDDVTEQMKCYNVHGHDLPREAIL